MDNDMDYAELWLEAQKAHKAIFEAALAKDYMAAMTSAESLRLCSELMADWFEDAHLRSVGK